MIKVNDLHKSFNGIEVLKGITEHIDDGEVVVVIGPSGSGKSTMIHLIPRLYDVSEGRVTFDGIDVRQLDLT